MDRVSIANAYVGATQAQTGQAIQTKLLKMAADQQASLVALLEEGAQNLEAVKAAPGAGLGTSVDVTA
ncbi:MAG: putative motility protein [Roseibium sp.]|nr:putative motility protein [Roseibium sp.]